MGVLLVNLRDRAGQQDQSWSECGPNPGVSTIFLIHLQFLLFDLLSCCYPAFFCSPVLMMGPGHHFQLPDLQTAHRPPVRNAVLCGPPVVSRVCGASSRKLLLQHPGWSGEGSIPRKVAVEGNLRGVRDIGSRAQSPQMDKLRDSAMLGIQVLTGKPINICL